MLNEYNRKRDFKKTPEPSGKSVATPQGPLRFVIQKHAARRLHYDFRLEIDGVLVSWAVPKGPALDPREKRLAVQTEDHPLGYADFEGIIPAGEYGGGEVIVWDRGTYTPDEEGKLSWDNRPEAEKRMREGLRKGKISVFIEGEKLRGSWTFVKLKNKEKDWLLIKHRDPFAALTNDPTEQEESVISGRTISDIKESKTTPVKRSPKLDLGTTARFPNSLKPMLASLTKTPFSREGWVFEPKMDGIRALAYIRDGKITLNSRRGLDLTEQYPFLVRTLSKYTFDAVLDGEIIALNERGRPSFQTLQQRSGLTHAADIRNAESKTPIFYYVFDILYCNGRDLRQLPLVERRKILQRYVMPSHSVRIIEQFSTDGESAYKACVENEMEGVVAKRLDSTYESGRRSKAWLKIKSTLSSEFLICGFTEGTGSRNRTFGSLLLGEHNERGELEYVGGVGTGFGDTNLQQLIEAMTPLITKKCPFSKRPPGKLNPTWVTPSLVAEIKYAERTQDNILRAPVFMHLRKDIVAQDVKPMQIVETEDLEPVTSVETGAAAQDNLISDILAQLDNQTEKLNLEVEGNGIAFSNLNKVMWPATDTHPAVTKRDYVRYLAEVSPYILPHLRDRLITLVRFPNGINQSRFYQKHWDKNLPAFVSTVRYFTEHFNGDQDFLVCNNTSTLLWLAQLADLELHTSHSRNNPEPDATNHSRDYTGSVEKLQKSLLNYPDYLVFDLDPYMYSGKEKKGAEPELHAKGFQQACDLAFWLKELLDSLKIKTFIKTSGRTGLHIYIPIARQIDYETVRALSEIIGRQILKDHPEDVTMDWAVVKRKGKTFLDHNMNARGKTLASIYSPRVAAEASVSTPVRWDDLRSVYPTEFTIWTVPDRLKKIGDLWSDILLHKNDLETLLIKNENAQAASAALAPKIKTKPKKTRSAG